MTENRRRVTMDARVDASRRVEIGQIGWRNRAVGVRGPRRQSRVLRVLALLLQHHLEVTVVLKPGIQTFNQSINQNGSIGK